MTYRSEIDGLRALAVLPVILFHAGFETFSGGFVGVDVFFVISGYLITSIILSGLEQGKFSLAGFYERRARRILPALFFMLLVCTPLAWLLLTTAEFKDYSRSLAAVSIFSSNIVFWLKSGYFDTAAELKPLLHTWSLAVEEQYYLVFPLLMVFHWKVTRRWMLLTFGLVFVASLATAHWASYAHPSAAYYLLPTRAWELLIGTFVALYLSHAHRSSPGKIASDLGAALGIVLIFVAVFFYSKKTPFPGIYALVPTLGAALFITYASDKTVVGRVMGSEPLVGIGLMSYGAYLWHQPLFVFVRQLNITHPNKEILLLVSVLSFVFAYISWKFVEMPFRSSSKISRLQVFKFAIIGSLLFAVLGCYGLMGNKIFIRLRLVEDRLFKVIDIHHGSTRDPQVATDMQVKKPDVKYTDKNFIVIGDSHGEHLLSGILSITTGIVQNYTSDGCIPFRNVDRFDFRMVPGKCAKGVSAVLDEVIQSDPEAIVVLSSMGPVYLDGVTFKGKGSDRVTGLGVEYIPDRSVTDRYEVFRIGLRQTLAELSKLSKAQVVFAFDVPELGIDYGCNRPPNEMGPGAEMIRHPVSNMDIQSCFVLRAEYDERVAAYKKLVLTVVSDFPKVRIFDPALAFCNQNLCQGYDPRYGFLYRDYDHLSDSGSRFYAENFVRFLRQE